MNPRLLFIYLMLLFSSACGAESISGINSGNLILGDFDAFSRNTRKEIAIDLNKKINDLLFSIPIQNPDDLAWLESEKRELIQIESTQKIALSNRQIAYVESKQFQQRQLRVMLSNISEAISCILKANNAIKKEMVCWTVASSNLLERDRFQSAISILTKHGLLPKVNTEFREDYWYAVYGKGIIDYILLPYLRSQSK